MGRLTYMFLLVDDQNVWMAYLSEVAADVIPAWHCVNTDMNAPDKKPTKSSAFIAMLTLIIYQLIKWI